MFFWFKKKKVILNCYTFSNIAYEYSPIDRLVNYIPEWFRKTKKHEDVLTIKNCIGILDYYKKGIALSSWNYFDIKIDNSGYQWSTALDSGLKSDVTEHFPSEFKKFEFDSFGNRISNLKIVSPWIFFCDKNKYFLFSSPMYNIRDMFTHMTLMPGVIEFKYNHDTNINYMVSSTKDPVHINLKLMTPLVGLFPLFDDELEIRNHLVSVEEYNNLNKMQSILTDAIRKMPFNFYKEKKRIVDSLDSRNKCPFKHD